MIKTLKLKVKPESYNWLNKAAIEVNQVWNWCNEYSQSRIKNGVGAPSGYYLNRASSGCSRCFLKINANTIQVVGQEYARKRNQARKIKLKWRASFGPRRSLGWVPYKSQNLKKNGKVVCLSGKTFRLFESHLIQDVKIKDGCFAQDAMGDWYLCAPVEVSVSEDIAPKEEVGIDLGLKDTATTSDGDRLPAGRYFRDTEQKIAQAQRRGHKKQAKRYHRKAARQRRDALHKFSRKIVNSYQYIVVGDVSSSRLAKTKMAKSVLDSGWYMLKTQLQYKGQQAGRSVEIVNEAFTTRACSNCGSLSGPSGLDNLVVREWACTDCETVHDRDVNAARNILALRHQRPSAGTSRKLAA